MARHKSSVPPVNVEHDYFENSFLPSTVIEWNKLDSNIRNSESLIFFKKRILDFIGPFANTAFQCHNPKGLKLITRLRLGLSHLRFHKFKHSFQDTLNPTCKITVEITVHYLLYCLTFSNERLTFLNKLRSIDANILSKDDSNISKVLLYGDQSFNDYKRYFYFSCLNWIYNFNKTFWCSLISKLTHLFVYVQFIFRFCQEIACKFILFSFVFCILIIASFILFCKMIYIIRFFFL